MKFVKNHENRETISRGDLGCFNNRRNVDTRLDMSCDRLEHKTFRLWSVVTSCVPTKTYWTHSVCLIKLGATSHVSFTAAWEALLLGSLLKRLRDTSYGDRDRLTHSQARSRFLRSDAMELVGARRCRARARINFRQGVGGTSIFQIPYNLVSVIVSRKSLFQDSFLDHYTGSHSTLQSSPNSHSRGKQDRP